MGPPPEFVDLSTARNAAPYSFVSVMGVVVDLRPPTQTRVDWMLTFKVLDPRIRDAVYGMQGLTVRFFKRDFEHLPKVQNLGDIVLLRDIKVMPVSGEKMLVSNYQTSAVVFPGASIPDLNFQVAYEGTQRLECLGAPQDKAKVTLQEQSYVFALRSELKDTVDALPNGNLTGMPANGIPVTTDAPAAKRPRLSEPSLPPRPPVNPPTGPSALQSRRADIPRQPQAQARPSRQSSFGAKYKTVREIAHRDFADICAEVVKKYPLPFGGCELYVTDYTANKDMWYYTPPEEDQDIARDGDMFGYAGGAQKRQFPGPYGWLVLKVNVKDPHASFVNDRVKEGDFVLLQNVKMKIMSDGAKLEGDMWPDSMNPDRVQVSTLMNHTLPEIDEIRERKEKYWAGRESKNDNQENAKLSKSEKKRQKKKKQKAEKKAAEAGVLDDLFKDQSKADINPHVRCSNDEAPIMAVKDILDLENERHTTVPPHGGGESYVIPFINAKYRARVHVIDYEPKALEDFAIPAEEEEGDEDNDDAMSLDGRFFASNPSQKQKWEWSFRLLLEDARTAQNEGEHETRRIWTAFTHESAQYLFGNSMEDPGDLRADGTLLAKLRERLYILWGNLAETKAGLNPRGGEVVQGGGEGERLSNRAFECCIMEYGVPVAETEGGEGGEGRMEGGVLGFERCFAGFGVTIT